MAILREESAASFNDDNNGHCPNRTFELSTGPLQPILLHLSPTFAYMKAPKIHGAWISRSSKTSRSFSLIPCVSRVFHCYLAISNWNFISRGCLTEGTIVHLPGCSACCMQNEQTKAPHFQPSHGHVKSTSYCAPT